MEKLQPEGNEIDESSLKHNLEIMNSEMLRFLGHESIGGNAGAINIDGKSYSCAGANGYADKWTGEIIGFANAPKKLEKLAPTDISLLLKIAYDQKSIGFFKIVGHVFYKTEKNELSQKARATLEESIRLWNEMKEQEKSAQT